jgi:hypothetical protein
VQDTTLEELDRLIAVNVRGTFLCCKHAYEHLRRARGSIINVSSMAGVHGEKHHAAYGMSKGAMNALTHCMAIDWGPDIRVERRHAQRRQGDRREPRPGGDPPIATNDPLPRPARSAGGDRVGRALPRFK